MNCAYQFAILTVLGLVVPSFAQDQDKINDSVHKGIHYLEEQIDRNLGIGETALATLAMVKGTAHEQELPAAVGRGLARLNTRIVNDRYLNDRAGGPDNYEAALVLLAYASVDSELYLPQIRVVANYILSKQLPSGSWGYSDGRQDTSMTQYACLGLKAASDAGVKIPPKVWDNAMYWFMSRQDVGGGFTYHPQEPPAKWPIAQPTPTHTMSTGGTVSLYICRMQLPYLQSKDGKKPRESSELMTKVIRDMEDAFEPKVKFDAAKKSIERAEKWMVQNLQIEGATGPLHYFLYALERYAAIAAPKEYERIYRMGASFIVEKQQADGHWEGAHGAVVDTSFTVLFLGRATRKDPPKVLVLYGGGIQQAGRGIPTDHVIPQRFVDKLDSDALRNMVTIAEFDESHFDLEGDEQQVLPAAKIVRAAKGNLDRLSKLAQDSRFQVRLVSYAALAESNDPRVIPQLIAGLDDKDDVKQAAYQICRSGLLLISRKTDTFGLTIQKKDAKSLAESIQAWNNWYRLQRVELTAEQEFDLASR